MADSCRSLDRGKGTDTSSGETQGRLGASDKRVVRGTGISPASASDANPPGAGPSRNRGGDGISAGNTGHRTNPVEFHDWRGSKVVTADRDCCASRTGGRRERGDHGWLIRPRPGINHVLQVGGHSRIHIREKVEPSDLLDFLDRGNVALPRSKSRAGVRR